MPSRTERKYYCHRHLKSGIHGQIWVNSLSDWENFFNELSCYSSEMRYTKEKRRVAIKCKVLHDQDTVLKSQSIGNRWMANSQNYKTCWSCDLFVKAKSGAWGEALRMAPTVVAASIGSESSYSP